MSTRRATAAPLNAFVLHHHDWSESSVILELFSREMGRLVAVAKGAKRPHSQLRAVLLPLQRIHIQLGRHKGDEQPDVHLLRSAEWAGGSAMPGGDALLAGLHLNELLLRALARHDAHPRLFDAYAACLHSLGQAHRAGLDAAFTPTPQPGSRTVGQDDEADPPEHQIGAALRAFELLLLQETGVLPQLGCVTLTQQPLLAGRRYQLQGEAGVCAVTDDDAGLAPVTLAALQAALDAHDVAALQQACRAAPNELKLQLRGLLHYHLGHQPLRTRALMADVQRLID
jgi:DNA repair protein RecO (recombination protein O)